MIVALDEIPRAAEPCEPSLDWRPVRDHLGISAFGVNAFLGHEAGDRVVELHDEDGELGHEELYVVVRGGARFVIDGEQHDVPAGGLVLVAPGSTREAFACAPNTAVLVVGAQPGVPFSPSAWEERQLRIARHSGPPARRWSLSQPDDQVADCGGLGEEWVVAGVEFHDAGCSTGELALQVGWGALVLRADEVRRGHVPPGR
jgi:hypothetical protein